MLNLFWAKLVLNFAGYSNYMIQLSSRLKAIFGTDLLLFCFFEARLQVFDLRLISAACARLLTLISHAKLSDSQPQTALAPRAAGNQ